MCDYMLFTDQLFIMHWAFIDYIVWYREQEVFVLHYALSTVVLYQGTGIC